MNFMKVSFNNFQDICSLTFKKCFSKSSFLNNGYQKHCLNYTVKRLKSSVNSDNTSSAFSSIKEISTEVDENDRSSSLFSLKHNFKYSLTHKSKCATSLEKNYAENTVNEMEIKSTIRENKFQAPDSSVFEKSYSNDISNFLFDVNRKIINHRLNSDQIKKYRLANFRIRKKKLPQCQGEVLFGINPVLLALQEKRRTFYQLYLKQSRSETPYLQNIKALAEEMKIPQIQTDLWTLDAMSQGRPHQGVCLEASKIKSLPLPDTFEITSTHNPLWLVLDSIKDPMNFGAVLRSAYYLGVDRIIVTQNNSCRLSTIVSKASSGALELMPIYHVNNLVEFIQNQKNQGWEILGTVNSLKMGVQVINVEDYVLSKPSILIIGNENKGISPDILNLCRYYLTVTSKSIIHPNMDSLNVSVATGIILFHLSRQRSTTQSIYQEPIAESS